MEFFKIFTSNDGQELQWKSADVAFEINLKRLDIPR